MARIHFVPQGTVGDIADTLMERLMYWLQSTSDELPQRTHPWNNIKLKRDDIRWLQSQNMVTALADANAVSRSLIPRYHAPRFGGWREFIVLQVEYERPWFVGWISDTVCGLSRIPLYGHVRVLRSDEETRFFGVNLSGEQVKLSQIGSGRVGVRHDYGDIPLL